MNRGGVTVKRGGATVKRGGATKKMGGVAERWKSHYDMGRDKRGRSHYEEKSL